MFGERGDGVDVGRRLGNCGGRDLESLLDYCGFQVVRRKHFSLRDNPAGFASSIAPGLDPMARRVRKLPESTGVILRKDFFFFCSRLASLPVTFFLTDCCARSTIIP